MVRDWSNAMADLETERPAAAGGAAQAVENLSAYFLEQVELRRRAPRDDLMSRILEASYRDPAGGLRRLTDQEAVTFFGLLSGAGNDTTVKFVGNAVLALAEHPSQRSQLVRNPRLARNAVREILRYDGVAHYQFRYVTRDVEWYGEKIPEGSWLVLVQGATGRDERKRHNFAKHR